jgi:xylan 1,4-beta-xylosidase
MGLMRSVGMLVLGNALVLSVAGAAVAEEAAAKTYKNPLLTEHSPADPHVIRFEGKYYLYPTSHGRGYDAYVSDNLVDWKNAGTVFHDPRGGAWAPDVFRPRGEQSKFYLYYTDSMPDGHAQLDKQIGVAEADGPLGPFEDRRVLVKNAIDGHMFEDVGSQGDSGKLYLYYVRLTGGFCILVQPMADPLTPVGEPTELIRPTEPWEMASGHVTEGPFVLKRGDTYYLMYSGSGADSPNYGIGYATAKSPTGPFTKYAGNPIVSRSEKVFGPGHHSVVEGPRGDLWMVYHQKRNARTNWQRFLALDRMWFDEEGVIHARATRGTEEERP